MEWPTRGDEGIVVRRKPRFDQQGPPKVVGLLAVKDTRQQQATASNNKLRLVRQGQLGAILKADLSVAAPSELPHVNRALRAPGPARRPGKRAPGNQRQQRHLDGAPRVDLGAGVPAWSTRVLLAKNPSGDRKSVV